jgi:hypothetical protein
MPSSNKASKNSNFDNQFDNQSDVTLTQGSDESEKNFLKRVDKTIKNDPTEEGFKAAVIRLFKEQLNQNKKADQEKLDLNGQLKENNSNQANSKAEASKDKVGAAENENHENENPDKNSDENPDDGNPENDKPENDKPENENPENENPENPVNKPFEETAEELEAKEKFDAQQAEQNLIISKNHPEQSTGGNESNPANDLEHRLKIIINKFIENAKAIGRNNSFDKDGEFNRLCDGLKSELQHAAGGREIELPKDVVSEARTIIQTPVNNLLPEENIFDIANNSEVSTSSEEKSKDDQVSLRTLIIKGLRLLLDSKKSLEAQDGPASEEEIAKQEQHFKLFIKDIENILKIDPKFLDSLKETINDEKFFAKINEELENNKISKKDTPKALVSDPSASPLLNIQQQHLSPAN